MVNSYKILGMTLREIKFKKTNKLLPSKRHDIREKYGDQNGFLERQRQHLLTKELTSIFYYSSIVAWAVTFLPGALKYVVIAMLTFGKSQCSSDFLHAYYSTMKRSNLNAQLSISSRNIKLKIVWSNISWTARCIKTPLRDNDNWNSSNLFYRSTHETVWI